MPIPLALRKEMAADPYYSKCARAGPECDGRITWEHALYHAGKKMQDKFSIIPLCWAHHLGPHLHKATNQLIAIQRMTEADRKKYDRTSWQTEERRLRAVVKAKQQHQHALPPHTIS